MVEHLAHWMLMQTLTLAVACGTVRLLQMAMVRWLGAGAGYLAWLLVPVAMLAVALPHPAADALVIRVPVAAAMPAWAAAPAAAVPTHGRDFLLAVIAAWAAGVLLLVALLVGRQRRFLACIDGGLPAGAGPAVLGVWRRRIVLPRDFDVAFDAEERRLMLLHEGVHLRRADNAWNLLASALLVLHWFNPVAWWAWRRLRLDQELACDAVVLRQESADALASYAGALLKVQGLAFAPPLATSWQSTHPLVERVRMLQLHRISSARHRLGRRVAMLAVALAGLGGYALEAGALPAAPGTKASVMTTIDVTDTIHTAAASGVQDKTVVQSRFSVMTHLGEKAVVRLAEDSHQAPNGRSLQIDLTVSRADASHLQLDARVNGGAPPAALASPRLLVRDGEKADLRVTSDDGAHEIALSFQPRLVTQPLPPLPAVPALAPAPPVPPVPGHAGLPPLPAPPAPMSLPELPSANDLPAPPAPPALPAVPGAAIVEDRPAPPAPPQRAN